MQQLLTVVIPWNNRPELERTLAQNAPIFRHFGLSIIIVNCGGNHEDLNRLVSAAKAKALLIELPRVEFNKSLALNIGIDYSSSEYIFALDADMIVPPKTMNDCLNALESGQVLSIARARETHPRPDEAMPFGTNLCEIVHLQSVEFVWGNGQTTSAPSYRTYLSDGSRGGQGQLLVRRDDLLAIEGYNSQLREWGFEDIDMLIRLQHGLNLKHREIGEVIHLSHDDSVRALRGDSRRECNLRNLRIACEKYCKGNFKGSLSQDLSCHKKELD